MTTRVLTTTQTNPTTLVDTEGQPYPVAPEAGGGTVVPPLYSVVLRPGDTSGADNVFTSWAALYAACNGIPGGVRVVGDDTLGAIHIPAGAYVISNWRFDSEPSFTNANGGAVFIWDDGATIVKDANGNIGFTLGSWTYFESASTTTAVLTLATGEVNVKLEAFSAINSTGAHGFFHVTGLLAAAFLWLHMTNASIGDSAHPTIIFEAGAGGQVNMVSSEIHTLALQGAGIAGLEVFPSYDSNVETPNAPTFVWGNGNENMGTQGLAPVVAPLAAAGVGATAVLTPGSDATAGSILLTPAGAPTAGDQFSVTFARAFNAAPKTVLFSPGNAAASASNFILANISSVTANGWRYTTANALVAGTSYLLNYMVLG